MRNKEIDYTNLFCEVTEIGYGDMNYINHLFEEFEINEQELIVEFFKEGIEYQEILNEYEKRKYYKPKNWNVANYVIEKIFDRALEMYWMNDSIHYSDEKFVEYSINSVASYLYVNGVAVFTPEDIRKESANIKKEKQ